VLDELGLDRQAALEFKPKASLLRGLHFFASTQTLDDNEHDRRAG